MMIHPQCWSRATHQQNPALIPRAKGQTRLTVLFSDLKSCSFMDAKEINVLICSHVNRLK